MAGPAEYAEDEVLADIETGVDECLVPLRPQALQVNLIDSDGTVCFVLYGDDLLPVER